MEMLILNKIHCTMSSRRQSNAIITVDVNSVRVEGVENVHRVVFNHFQSHFQVVNIDRLGVENFNMKSLSMSKRENIIKPFTI